MRPHLFARLLREMFPYGHLHPRRIPMIDWPDVVFCVPNSELPAFLAALGESPNLNHEVLPKAGAAGSGDIVTVLVQLTPAALTFVGGLVTAWMTRPRATIEIGGFKATGLSNRAVEDALRRELDKAQSGPIDNAK